MAARLRKWILYVLLLTTGSTALAAAGVRRGARGIKNPDSLNGLCTKRDGDQRWVARGWCKTMREALSVGAKNCAHSKFEDVRQKAKSGKLKGIKDYCPNIEELAADEVHFASFLTNLIAGLAIEESDWSQSTSTNYLGAQGTLQLSWESVKQKPYRCGCEGIKKRSDLNDPHKNITCGSYIALHWLSKDSQVGSGSGNERSRGIARYFQPFRDGDRLKRGRIQKKLSKYCRERGRSDLDLAEAKAAQPPQTPANPNNFIPSNK